MLIEITVLKWERLRKDVKRSSWFAVQNTIFSCPGGLFGLPGDHVKVWLYVQSLRSESGSEEIKVNVGLATALLTLDAQSILQALRNLDEHELIKISTDLAQSANSHDRTRTDAIVDGRARTDAYADDRARTDTYANDTNQLELRTDTYVDERARTTAYADDRVRVIEERRGEEKRGEYNTRNNVLVSYSGATHQSCSEGNLATQAELAEVPPLDTEPAPLKLKLVPKQPASGRKQKHNPCDVDLALKLWDRITTCPAAPTLEALCTDDWANQMRLLRTTAGSAAVVHEVVRWIYAERTTWSHTIAGPRSLRRHWDQIAADLRGWLTKNRFECPPRYRAPAEPKSSTAGG